MSEKGDMPGDTVSLPPNYAPSEAFTESPPPAYRGGAKSSRVQIVKLICVTVVVSAVIIGFFIITSNYLNARACQCPQHIELDKLKTAGIFELPRASSLVGKEPNQLEEEAKGEGKQLVKEGLQEGTPLEEEVKENDLDLGDDTTLPKIDLEVVEEEVPLPPEQVEELVEEVQEVEKAVEEELAREEEEEEAIQDILSAQLDHMKKIKLPVDLILGNPALAGRNVNCEVERRQQPIGPGIMTQAIIVTCKDPSKPRRPRPGPTPPLSILGPIMKMLASRSAKVRPFPCAPNTPCFPPPKMMIEGRNIVPIGVRGPISILAPSPRFVPQPRFAPQPRLAPEENDGPRNKMLPIQLQPLVKMSPRVPRLLTPPQPFPAPVSLASLHRGALPMPLPLPQPRAAKDPISLPSIRLRPAPFLPQNINVVRGARRDDRPITHMEMKAPPPPPTANPRPLIPREFGPPRIHTVLTPAQPQKQFKGTIVELKPESGAPEFRGPLPFNGPIPFDGPMFRGPAPSDGPQSRGPNPFGGPESRGPNPFGGPESRGPNPFDGPIPSEGPKFRGPIFSDVPKFRGPVPAENGPNAGPQFRGPIFPAHLPRNIRIQTSPLPKDVMEPPKPVARVSQPSVLPIAGPPSFPPPPPPPRFDPNGRRGDVKEINTEAEIIVKDLPTQPSAPLQEQPAPPQQQPPSPPRPSPQQSPPRKHHLLLVN